MSELDNPLKNISVLVDNKSWILPYALQLVDWCNANGFSATFYNDHSQIEKGDVAFFLGCVQLVPSETLEKNTFNLVIHASDLPKNRGMSPWTWSVLEGADEIIVSLLEAEIEVDSGVVYKKDSIMLDGTELVEDLRLLIGKKTLELSKFFLKQKGEIKGQPQDGEPTFCKLRTKKDSFFDIEKTVLEQINLLRVVDNEKYPAWFEYKGQKYLLKIEKEEK